MTRGLTIGDAIVALTIAVQRTCPKMSGAIVHRVVYGMLRDEISRGFWRQA